MRNYRPYFAKKLTTEQVRSLRDQSYCVAEVMRENNRKWLATPEGQAATSWPEDMSEETIRSLFPQGAPPELECRLKKS